MAKNVQFKLNINGLRELMKSDWMQGHLAEASRAVADACGSDYESDVDVISYVAIGHVRPTTKEASRENYEENTMIKALSSAGLRMEKS